MPDTRHQRSRHAARLGETPRTNQKTAASEGEGRWIGKHLVRAGTQEHPTHEPLISRTTLAEVPLAGLSFGAIAHDLNQTRHLPINLKFDRMVRDWNQSQP